MCVYGRVTRTSTPSSLVGDQQTMIASPANLRMSPPCLSTVLVRRPGSDTDWRESVVRKHSANLLFQLFEDHLVRYCPCCSEPGVLKQGGLEDTTLRGLSRGHVKAAAACCSSQRKERNLNVGCAWKGGNPPLLEGGMFCSVWDQGKLRTYYIYCTIIAISGQQLTASRCHCRCLSLHLRRRSSSLTYVRTHPLHNFSSRTHRECS